MKKNDILTDSFKKRLVCVYGDEADLQAGRPEAYEVAGRHDP